MTVAPHAEPSVPRLLVCAPDHFDTHFLFNPWMGYREKVDRRRAAGQWRRLVGVLEEAGADVVRAEPAVVTSALPFTADAALCYSGGRALVLRNDGLRGDLEPPVVAAWLHGLGLQTESLPPAYRLEGGNLVWAGPRLLLAGLKPGADGRAERYLARLLKVAAGVEVRTVRLLDERHLHLDTALAFLRDDLYLVHRPALGDDPPPGEAIEVGEADARAFGCNLVCVGDVVVTGLVSDVLARRIARHGFHVERVDLTEFHKAGGGAKCLTLPLQPPEGGREWHGTT